MKKINVLLILAMLISVFFTFYKNNQVPGCINADEAAFGYNAFSILKTLKDEHGAFLPLRLLSFNDLKLPLYSYLSIPFIGIFGLNMFSTRMVSHMAGILLVPLFYYLSLELFRNKKIAYVSAFLAAISPWIYIVSRHAHETALATLFIGTSLVFLLRYRNTSRKIDAFLSLLSIFLATFTYHNARLFLFLIVFLFLQKLYQRSSVLKESLQKNWAIMVLLAVVLLAPFVIDITYGASRLNNLVFTHNSGFQKKLDQYLNEHPTRPLHNKLTQSIKEFSLRYGQEISPDFLVVNGDANPRFGMDWLGLITPIEYAFIFIGLFLLFSNKEKHRHLVLSLLLLAPVSNALTWSPHSLTRTFPMILPIELIVAYGFVTVLENMKHNNNKRLYFSVGIISAFFFFNISNHDLYFNHYFKRPLHVEAWQCGYKDLADYVKNSYDDVDSYYFTRRYGQPYIFLLYFMQYDPQKYHNTATLSKPDEYGFTQVESFDKFHFELPSGSDFPKNSVIVGLPDEFSDRSIDASKVTKVRYGEHEVFWIYRN